MLGLVCQPSITPQQEPLVPRLQKQPVNQRFNTQQATRATPISRSRGRAINIVGLLVKTGEKRSHSAAQNVRLLRVLNAKGKTVASNYST